MIFERIKNKSSRNSQQDITSGLFQALLYLNSVEECYIFFGDLCTNLEINTMSQRFEVARLLYNGCLYNDIVSRTGASTATISRVNRSLKDNTNGYINALRHLYPIDENKK
ncbi:MAG: YerC/YecD family TrpR-related protein [Oscillospiraceae bacterium]|nr:YerC/YecD family TrpR-related protein [Oscillospiraceae bacterium]